MLKSDSKDKKKDFTKLFRNGVITIVVGILIYWSSFLITSITIAFSGLIVILLGKAMVHYVSLKTKDPKTNGIVMILIFIVLMMILLPIAIDRFFI